MKRVSYPAGIVVGLVVVLAAVAWGVWHSGATQGGTTYVDPAHRFSFQIPPSGTVEYAVSDDGTIESLAMKGSANENFTATISPWPDAGLSEDELLRQYPTLADYKYGAITVDGRPGITYEDLTAGTRDVWFVSGGYLYQFTIETRLPAVIESLQLGDASSSKI